MVTPADIPWAGLLVVAITVVCILSFSALVQSVVVWTTTVRDALRGRYVEGRWQPALFDLVGVPLWIFIEVACLVGSVLFAMIALLLIYQVAKGFRDWWHTDGRKR